MALSDIKSEKSSSYSMRKGKLQLQLGYRRDLLEELPLLYSTKSRSQQRVYFTPSIYSTIQQTKSPGKKYLYNNHYTDSRQYLPNM